MNKNPNTNKIKPIIMLRPFIPIASEQQNKIPINVFDFKAQGSLVKIMNGEDVGTYVSVN